MLDEVKKYIEKLISLYETEKQRGDELASKLSQSEELVETYKSQITELTRQIDSFKLAGAFAAGDGNTEARERIDKLIREIDRCIRLLEN